MKELLLNKTFFVVLLGVSLLAPIFGFCQVNWVKNGDLEEYMTCPDNDDQISRCTDWYRFQQGLSPDYFNACANPSANNVGVPYNFGYQTPHSGNGYIHSIILSSEKPKKFTGFSFDPNYQFRESFGGSFISPLDIGVYQIEFYVSCAVLTFGNASNDRFIATNAIDIVLLNDNNELYCTAFPYLSSKQIIKMNKDNIIKDTVNWVKLSACFYANESFTHFGVGAFRDTNEINLEFYGNSQINFYGAWYFFDDFKVTKCDTCCFGEFPYEDHLTIYSNPGTAHKPTTFEILLNPNTNASLDLYDFAGRLVARNVFSELLNTYTLPPLAEGVYHYVFSSSGGAKENGKVVVLE